MPILQQDVDASSFRYDEQCVEGPLDVKERCAACTPIAAVMPLGRLDIKTPLHSRERVSAHHAAHCGQHPDQPGIKRRVDGRHISEGVRECATVRAWFGVRFVRRYVGHGRGIKEGEREGRPFYRSRRFGSRRLEATPEGVWGGMRVKGSNSHAGSQREERRPSMPRSGVGSAIFNAALKSPERQFHGSAAIRNGRDPEREISIVTRSHRNFISSVLHPCSLLVGLTSPSLWDSVETLHNGLPPGSSALRIYTYCRRGY